MDLEIMNLLGDTQKKMSGYTALMNFRFMNLCTKAEPSALLPVTVTIDNETFDLESVAQAAAPEKNQFLIIPKEQEYIFAICKALATAHPEFNIERQTMPQKSEDTNVSEDDKQEIIRCTVPDLNKERHDLIMQGISLLSDETKEKINKVFANANAQIAEMMAGIPQENIDEVKHDLQESYDLHNDMCKQYREKKEKEVEDAYQLYLQKQDAKEVSKREEEDARGEKVGFQMKLDQNDK
ncbi:MAG: ribosome recycling factor [Tannerellaceae bacterium]